MPQRGRHKLAGERAVLTFDLHPMTVLQDLSRDLEQLVAKAAPSVVSVHHAAGQGSGLVLAPDGYLLTNAHVARAPNGRSELRAGLADGSDHRARVVGADPKTDLAVVKIDAHELASLPLADGRALRVGQLVVAIGNPLRFERSVSLGVISALDRTLPAAGTLLEGLIQTDAAINPGNSGGPLVDVSGAVVGLSTAIVPFAQGLGFAVPAQTAAWIAAVLIQKGRVERPIFGVAARGVELPGMLARDLGQARAVHVMRVVSGGPAASAGLREGDLLLSANGEPLASIDDLQRAMVLGTKDLLVAYARESKRAEALVRPEVPKAA
jgi:S1-C subfamily serine protease